MSLVCLSLTEFCQMISNESQRYFFKLPTFDESEFQYVFCDVNK